MIIKTIIKGYKEFYNYVVGCMIPWERKRIRTKERKNIKYSHAD
jgi:hypothetical protein